MSQGCQRGFPSLVSACLGLCRCISVVLLFLFRLGILATEEILTPVKKDFEDFGLQGVGGLCFGVGNPGELLCSLSSSAHDVVREVSVSEFALSRDGLVGSSEPGFRLSSESPDFLRGRCGFLISSTGCAPLLLVQFSSFHPILPTLKCAVNSMLKASGRESFPE
ncbi:hypothetical protein Bca101_058154 [Brassica carinata]